MCTIIKPKRNCDEATLTAVLALPHFSTSIIIIFNKTPDGNKISLYSYIPRYVPCKSLTPAVVDARFSVRCCRPKIQNKKCEIVVQYVL